MIYFTVYVKIPAQREIFFVNGGRLLKVLLVAINARFSHSNPAVYALKNSLTLTAPELADTVEICEFNINQTDEYILGEVYRAEAEIVGISCYIWNRSKVMSLVGSLKKIAPQVQIILGGPEVGHLAIDTLTAEPAVDFILQGEGELTFGQLLRAIRTDRDYTQIPGLVYRDAAGEIIANPLEQALNQPDLNLLPFPYTSADLDSLKGKIVYYESSRGCPYRCAYCLSAEDHHLRFLPVDRVAREIDRFVQAGIGLVKFVDRTFNCRPERARQIWQYLIAATGPETRFHFEIGADLLDEDSLHLLAQAPPGKFQFEVGVQSTNPEVLAAIGRPNRIGQIAANIRRLAAVGNIHLHLDLIAGLPLETLDSIARSFDAVWAMNPHHIQLGFLKVLPGTPIQRQAAQFGLIYRHEPPYEILQTPTLSYAELWQLKRIAELVEIYHNTGRFLETTKYISDYCFEGSAFGFYAELARWWVKNGLYRERHKSGDYYEYLYRFLAEAELLDAQALTRLTLDFVASEQYLDLPAWTGQKETEEVKKLHHELVQDPAFIAAVLPHYAGMRAREISKKTRLILTTTGEHVKRVLADYSVRDPITGRARLVDLDNIP